MKRLAFLISLLMTGQVLAYGTSKEDTTSAITVVSVIGMDSVFYSAGQDTTSWEINRREMSRAFSPDSTNYALRDTFDNPGTYFVKIEYWEGGAASAKYLSDIRDVSPSNFGIDGNDVWNASNSIVVTKGDVDSTVAGTKWLISHALTQGNYYWNDNMILFFTGTAAGQVARIVDFMAANDSVTFTPALTVAPTVGDSFMILGILSENIPDVNVVSADVDALDGVDFTEGYWAELADRADSGAAGGTGLDSATTSRIIGRKTWGIAAGSGSDSSTIAQRRVGWVDTTDYALNVPGVGIGTQPETVYVYDTGNSVTVPNIPIQARNSSGTNLGQVTTNSEGYGVLNQDDAATIYVRISGSSGYVAANNPETISVASPYRDTVNVTWFSPSAPAGDLCAVYNYVKDANDNGIAGVRITATIPTNFWPITYQGQAIKATYTTTTDGNGLWQLPVFPSGLLLTADGDSASSYQFTAPGGLFGPMGLKVTVPDSTTFFMIPDDEQ